MSFNFETVDADLGAVLKAALPDNWRVLDAAMGAPVNALTPTLTYLQTEVSPDMPDGGRLADDYYVVSFLLDLAVPEKDLIKGGKHLMTLLPQLYRALREVPDLDYDSATKAVDGVPYYRITISVLTHS